MIYETSILNSSIVNCAIKMSNSEIHRTALTQRIPRFPCFAAGGVLQDPNNLQVTPLQFSFS